MKSSTNSTAQVLTAIGIDIGKEVFHIVGFDAGGKIAFRRKIKWLALADTFKKAAVLGMGPCLSAHFVSRTLRQLGHEPRIIPAIYVKPFEPDVFVTFDVDGTAAAAARAIALDEAANEGYIVAGAHLPFPGIGRVARDETLYRLVPWNYVE